MNQDSTLIIQPHASTLPAPIAELGKDAERAFVEFFTAQIRNANTRAAYFRNAGRFLAWLQDHGLGLVDVAAFHAAAYIEELTQTYRPATVKQHLAGLRMLGSFLVVRQVLADNPFTEVRGPKHVVTEGKTPVMSTEDARQLFDSIDGDRVADLRDRALLAVMVYTFARVSAACGLDVPDYYQVGKRWRLDFTEKGGREKTMPVNHVAEDYLDAYLARLGEDSGPLFRAINPNRDGYTGIRLDRRRAWDMVKRRCRAAGLGDRFTNHTFRGTGITTYLKNSGQLEHAQYMAGHASPKTTKLYDRRQQEVTLDEVERIVI